jgi:nucleoside-diphosphate-sugar epimerase
MVGNGTVSVRQRDVDFPVRGQLNILRAKSDFGFYPTVDLEAGLLEYYDWLKND